jgi:hypothetical protein
MRIVERHVDVFPGRNPRKSASPIICAGTGERIRATRLRARCEGAMALPAAIA